MTARELLIIVIQQTRPADLWPHFENQATPEQIADHILTSRDEETLNSAADDYEALTREQHPGAIYGAIRRIGAYKVGAYLRARADAATGYSSTGTRPCRTPPSTSPTASTDHRTPGTTSARPRRPQ